MQWLHSIRFGNALVQETFGEYLVTLEHLSDKVERLDMRIAEFARQKDYAEKVNKLVCLTVFPLSASVYASSEFMLSARNVNAIIPVLRPPDRNVSGFATAVVQPA